MKLKESYCLEILDLMTKNVTVTNLKLVSANYTAKGLTAVVEDVYNSMQYEVSITPKNSGGGTE